MWMLTASGHDYHFSGPKSLGANARPVLIEDIAHHLGQCNRYNGATIRPCSVAEHSLLCADIAKHAGFSVIVQWAALMHDAHEFVTGDMSSPIKQIVNGYSMAAGGVEAWGLFEDEHERVVHKKFGMLTIFRSHEKVVKEIDNQALATERRDLTRFDPLRNLPWPHLDAPGNEVPPIQWIDLNTPEREAMTWRDWRDAFLSRFIELRNACEIDFKKLLARDEKLHALANAARMVL